QSFQPVIARAVGRLRAAAGIVGDHGKAVTHRVIRLPHRADHRVQAGGPAEDLRVARAAKAIEETGEGNLHPVVRRNEMLPLLEAETPSPLLSSVTFAARPGACHPPNR